MCTAANQEPREGPALLPRPCPVLPAGPQSRWLDREQPPGPRGAPGTEVSRRAEACEEASGSRPPPDSTRGLRHFRPPSARASPHSHATLILTKSNVNYQKKCKKTQRNGIRPLTSATWQHRQKGPPFEGTEGRATGGGAVTSRSGDARQSHEQLNGRVRGTDAGERGRGLTRGRGRADHSPASSRRGERAFAARPSGPSAGSLPKGRGVRHTDSHAGVAAAVTVPDGSQRKHRLAGKRPPRDIRADCPPVGQDRPGPVRHADA